MPDPAGLRRLALADLDDDTLLELVRHGEDLLVERKREPPPPPKFGAAVGSLANTLGGWVLLGVTDQGEVHGWEPPGGADVQSHLGAILRAQVDPLPPFVAAVRQVGGKPMSVIRVFASADAPHIVRGTGAVYVRSSKGKEPVDDHRTLLELTKRGEAAEREAASRLTEPITFISPGRPTRLRAAFSGDRTGGARSNSFVVGRPHCGCIGDRGLAGDADAGRAFRRERNTGWSRTDANALPENDPAVRPRLERSPGLDAAAGRQVLEPHRNGDIRVPAVVVALGRCPGCVLRSPISASSLCRCGFSPRRLFAVAPRLLPRPAYTGWNATIKSSWRPEADPFV